MSSNSQNEFEVKMVRIQRLDRSVMHTYDNNVRVNILSDIQRHLKYLCIMMDGKTVYKNEFSGLTWLSESSMEGVATICSSTFTIVIVYDAKNRSVLDSVADIQASLESKSRQTSANSIPSQLNPDQLSAMVDHLIRSINTGSSDDAEYTAQELAKVRLDVQFNLLSNNDKQERNTEKSTPVGSVAESLDSILQLTLRIECQMMRDPIIAPINICVGTTLHLLKQQIEEETGIQSANQYWFAFDRYPISDEYVFGSTVSVVSNQNHQKPLVNPIRSGDSLILYIASISS